MKVLLRPMGLTVALLLAGAAALPAAQTAPAIEVSGDIPHPLKLTANDLSGLPRASVELAADGIPVRYEGVWLHDILVRAGAPAGPALRGRALTTYVLAEASDGYQVVFSLGELDPAFGASKVLLADMADGKPLFGAQGAFRLVIAADQAGARSVRMLSKLTVVQLRK